MTTKQFFNLMFENLVIGKTFADVMRKYVPNRGERFQQNEDNPVYMRYEKNVDIEINILTNKYLNHSREKKNELFVILRNKFVPELSHKIVQYATDMSEINNFKNEKIRSSIIERLIELDLILGLEEIVNRENLISVDEIMLQLYLFNNKKIYTYDQRSLLGCGPLDRQLPSYIRKYSAPESYKNTRNLFDYHHDHRRAMIFNITYDNETDRPDIEVIGKHYGKVICRIWK